MLVMSQQFTITLELKFKASSNHELQIIADFIVII